MKFLLINSSSKDMKISKIDQIRKFTWERVISLLCFPVFVFFSFYSSESMQWYWSPLIYLIYSLNRRNLGSMGLSPSQSYSILLFNSLWVVFSVNQSYFKHYWALSLSFGFLLIIFLINANSEEEYPSNI